MESGKSQYFTAPEESTSQHNEWTLSSTAHSAGGTFHPSEKAQCITCAEESSAPLFACLLRSSAHTVQVAFSSHENPSGSLHL